MTLWSLVLQIRPLFRHLTTGEGALKTDTAISGIVGSVLLVLAIWLLVEAYRVLVVRRKSA